MKKILGISILSVLALSLFAVPALVSAKGVGETCQLTSDCDSGLMCKVDPTTGAGTCVLVGTKSPITDIAGIDALVRAVARWIAITVSVIAVIFIILGGVSYLTAGGDAEKAKAARQKVVYGMIGLAIAALAWGAEALVRSVLKLGQ